MSEQIVQVADASPSTKNMRTIQQTAGGNTVQSEVVILATGVASGGDTYDARQIRTLTSSDVVTAIQNLLGANDKPDITSNQSGTLKTSNANIPLLSTDAYGNLNTFNNRFSQALKTSWGPGWGNFTGW
jgi:hypothetical protein